MKSVSDIIFVDSLPSVDLHGYDRMYARLKVNEFINDNIKLKNEFITIVHGRGSGVLRNEVHNTLKNNKNVVEFALFYNNPGCTVVKLKKEVDKV